MSQLIIIDNYDSFTFNLVQFLGELGAKTQVFRNDALNVEDALARAHDANGGIILSPGPCTPAEAGICTPLVTAAATKKMRKKYQNGIPILGVCLGHQAIAAGFGAKIIRAPEIMHGKISPIEHTKNGIFEGLPTPLTATRYHSLVIDPNSLPQCLKVTAQTNAKKNNDMIIMGIQHQTLPIYGVQFHPESVATPTGHGLLANFLKIVKHAHA